MKTWLQALYLAFWMLPVQRVCTVLGAGVCAGLFGTVLMPTPTAALFTQWGYMIALAPGFLFGGAFWRAVSAQRAVLLAPRGRLRLLLAVAGVLAAIPVATLAFLVLHSVGMPRTPGSMWLLVAVPWFLSIGTFALGVWWLLATFITSRSPLAALLVLLALILEQYLLWRMDLSLDRLWARGWSPLLPIALLAAFATWYLRARRIAPPGWFLPGARSVLATVALADRGAAVVAKGAAMERMLLGGTSIPAMLMQWLLIGGALEGALLLTGTAGEDEAVAVAKLAFAAMFLCPLVVIAQSRAIVGRARALWLSSGCSRPELFASVERVLLTFSVGMALAFALLFVALWLTQPWHPAMTLVQGLCAIAAAALLAANQSLSRPVGWVLYAQIAVVVAVLLNVLRVLPGDPPGNWWWFAASLVVVAALRTMARRRWLNADLPRLTSSPAS
jgi:hypothetical protein